MLQFWIMSRPAAGCRFGRPPCPFRQHWPQFRCQHLLTRSGEQVHSWPFAGFCAHPHFHDLPAKLLARLGVRLSIELRVVRREGVGGSPPPCSGARCDPPTLGHVAAWIGSPVLADQARTRWPHGSLVLWNQRGRRAGSRPCRPDPGVIRRHLHQLEKPGIPFRGFPGSSRISRPGDMFHFWIIGARRVRVCPAPMKCRSVLHPSARGAAAALRSLRSGRPPQTEVQRRTATSRSRAAVLRTQASAGLVGLLVAVGAERDS